MTGIVLPKEDSLPEMKDEKEEVKQEQTNEFGLPLQDILIGLEQRILNLEAALLRIRGAI